MAPAPDNLTRREFLERCAACGLGLCGMGFLPDLAAAARPKGKPKRALYWRRMENGRTQCGLCPNRCVRRAGEDGRCRARGNRNGAYYSLAYGRPCVIALDPVEKCPLNHFQIRGKAFSIATPGCNLRCQYCHNWAFSQVGPDNAPKIYSLSPAKVVAKALENKAGAIAFFYTEPVIYYEYMRDIAKLAREKGLKNIMVTAGYVRPEPLKKLIPYLDAVTLGLKGWNEEYYRTYIGGELRHVRETARVLAAAQGLWWEVVTLLLPSLNDDMDEIADMARWLRRAAGPDVPLHFTRFRPEYRLKRLPMTPVKTLSTARKTALAQGLRHVYVGNLPGHEGAHTLCPHCGRVVVERIGFKVARKRLRGGKCSFCSTRIKGVWL